MAQVLLRLRQILRVTRIFRLMRVLKLFQQYLVRSEYCSLMWCKIFRLAVP